ncbi:MAG: S53 family peptidase [Isosphaeraceae bacterium]
MRRPPKKLQPRLEALEDRRLLSSITPAQMRHAYGVDAIAYSVNGKIVPGDGAGQTIAVVVAYHNPYVADELRAFDARFGLPDPNLIQVNFAGNQVDPGWAEEEAMDVQWAHAMAPAATIMVVEARSPSLGDLMNAVNYARQQPGVSVVSMSWGSGEFRGQTNYDSIFSTPAGHNGVTFVTASGDSGAFSGSQWPASSSHVVAVGGTTLYTDAAGNVQGENAWSGSGGGISRLISQPSYQRGAQNTGRRTTPDISMVADPATGAPVYSISPITGKGSWKVFGGTSLAAPMFGAMVAIANQGRQFRGLNTLDGPTQTLPTLYAASSGSFRDVTAGSNGYGAGSGYDLATGRGVPKGPLLVNDLVNAATAPVSQPVSFRPKGRVIRRARRRAEETMAAAAQTPQAVASTALGALPDFSAHPGAFSGRRNLFAARQPGGGWVAQRLA